MNTSLVPAFLIFFQKSLHFLSLVSEVVFCFRKKKMYSLMFGVIRNEEFFKYGL